MNEVISEEQLGSIDLRQFHQIWAVRGREDFQGVQIRSDRRMAPIVSPNAAAPVTVVNNLLIVVDDVGDPETINRLKAVVEAAWSGQ